MITVNPDLNTFYNPETKEWIGEKFHDYYDKNCSVGRIVFEEMRRRPNQISQISDTENTKLTNEEILVQAIKIVKFFEANGIKQTDFIGFVDRNTTYQSAVMFACLFHGCAFHAVNPYYDKKTMEHILAYTKPKIIFVDGRDYEKITEVTKTFKTKYYILKNHIAGEPSILDILETPSKPYIYEPSQLDVGVRQTMAILMSSGSTGLPKAVTISNNKRVFHLLNFLTSEDVLFVMTTMDWVTGLMSLLGNAIYGSKRIISDETFSPEYFLEVVETHKVTCTILPPTHVVMLLNCSQISVKKLESMRYMLVGGDKCTGQTLLKLQSYLKNGKVLVCYGFTEFGRCATVNTNLNEKPNSVGRIYPGYKMKIVNEFGESLGPGAIGEIHCYHGDYWNGYYGNLEATRKLYDESGWFHTGDLGYFDDDNYLYVVDRIKDFLKYRAWHYCPNEIEEVIEKMPGVVAVCVCGIWNELDGDAAAAAVVVSDGNKLTEQDIINFVKDNIEVEYKHLHAGVRILNELPRTKNNKVDRGAIKKMFETNGK